jgi:hypothetical protein
MRVSKCVGCKTFPCVDVYKDAYVLPDISLTPEDISIVLISESAPASPADYYYAKGNPSFQKTTVQAFNDAGVRVSSVRDIVNLGVYLTSAVKCGKTAYGIKKRHGEGMFLHIAGGNCPVSKCEVVYADGRCGDQGFQLYCSASR